MPGHHIFFGMIDHNHGLSSSHFQCEEDQEIEEIDPGDGFTGG